MRWQGELSQVALQLGLKGGSQNQSGSNTPCGGFGLGLCWRLPWGTFLPQLQGLLAAFSKATAAGCRRAWRGPAEILLLVLPAPEPTADESLTESGGSDGLASLGCCHQPCFLQGA